MTQLSDFEFVQLTQDTPLLPFVSEDYSHSGLGSQILEFIEYFLVANPKLGCRFLTVDAYSNVTNFYRKNDFEYFTMLDTLDKTRLMYFDLKPFKERIEQQL